MQQNNFQKNIELSSQAPKELKQATFKKIERLNVTFALLDFFAHIPKTLLEDDKLKDN
jgi:hypothetical protein